MNNLYESRRNLKYAFIIGAVLIAIASVVVSDMLIRKLAHEERVRMEIWTEAYRVLTTENTDQNLMVVLRIIEGNTSIPVILCDDAGNILSHRNIDVRGSDEDAFLKRKVTEFKSKNPPISVEIGPNSYQYLYYDDSILLKRLLMYPYVQLSVVFVFILLAFLALASTKRAEQNKVWVGLSKETAHQLGTPISSLIAWIEYLKTKEVDGTYLHEMEKDVKRLEVIADRFSKIGSDPALKPLNVNEAIRSACDYMSTRISSKIRIETEFSDQALFVMMNESLFSWVIENLTKNAVDAMEGQGVITFRTGSRKQRVWIEVTDTGKGIPKSRFQTIFNPGYTTKKRGWGLGLSLVRRIVETTPGSEIYVKSSEIGKGTTFRIEMRLRPHHPIREDSPSLTLRGKPA
ncbi:MULTISPECIES: sensor histidine kinase [Bacteroidales]|uniref:histidine kinase n=1 Tax=Tannerella forsythia TaxID=28112 RepID=A0A3P1YZ58_TANFO|nr:HAMP domain-containing sensor histidine kinase [Tannerella forsythia]RRD62086.1 sensor histidine kinase [Tannerella forsythia]RRD76294.1 sensor histidine kinase [Tannerella forsythia]